MERTIKFSEEVSVIVSPEGLVIDKFENGVRVSSKGRTYGEIEEEEPELFQLVMQYEAARYWEGSEVLAKAG